MRQAGENKMTTAPTLPTATLYLPSSRRAKYASDKGKGKFVANTNHVDVVVFETGIKRPAERFGIQSAKNSGAIESLEEADRLSQIEADARKKSK